MELAREIINNIKPNLEKALEFLKIELGRFHAGQISQESIEEIEVVCYGSQMPIKQLGAIRRPEAGVLVIEPWDKNITADIQKAILRAASSLSVVADGERVKIAAPSLTQETRQELMRELHQILEEARVSIRHQREHAWKEIQSLEKEGEISEDEKFRAKDELQKLIDNYNEKIEEMRGKKEREIRG